jgi:hypothetical protein
VRAAEHPQGDPCLSGRNDDASDRLGELAEASKDEVDAPLDVMDSAFRRHGGSKGRIG